MSSQIYFLADKFWKLANFEESSVGSEVEKHSSASEKMFKFAGRENRKAIEKKLRDAKMIYDARRLSLQGKRKQYEDMASVIDRESKEMADARDYMRKAYDVLKNMDLVDSNEVRFVGDDVGYVKRNRIYRLKVDDNGNVELEPFRRKQLPPGDEDLAMTEDDSSTDDELSADDLIASLVE